MSDHSSGPRALAGPHGDITDFYAFPSPERPGHLILVMNVLPRATASDFFSDAIICRFRLRPVTTTQPLASGKVETAFTVGDEGTERGFDITFEAPLQPDGGGALLQAGRCTPLAGGGEPVTFQVHDEQGGRASGLRVFAGVRSDPFFLDFPALMEMMNTGRLVFKEVGYSYGVGRNVLSVVVEVDYATLLAAGGGPLFAIVAETVVAGKIPIRLERVGRPEVKNIILSLKEHDTVNRDLEIRDLYNLEDAFHMGRDYKGAYRARMNANLAFYDSVDGKTDWPLDAQGNHPLTALLLEDHLIVDISKPYAEESWFEIERATLNGRAHATCGGRSLNDDFLDTLLTLMINAGNGPRIGDGVDQATVPASGIFPFLVPPNATFKAGE